MKFKDIINRIKTISPKIIVTDKDNVVENICVQVITLGIIFFDNLTMILDMVGYYVRTTDEVGISVIRCLLNAEDSLTISDSTLKAVIERLRYLEELQIDLDAELAKSELFINLHNGIYDIMNQQLITQDGNHIFDYCLNFSYKPGAKLDDAPNFKHFINTSLGEENYDCFNRVVGNCISSLTKGRKAFLLIGKGRTGKSTVLNLIESILDPDLVSHQPFHKMGSERSRWHYVGKRINISRDNSATPMKDEEGFKSLVSCEETVGREVYKKYIHFRPTLKFIFASNWPPVFAHPDDAVIDRLVVIRFTREIPEDQLDLELESKLKGEADTIFSIAIDSLKDLIESGYDFKESADSKEYIAQMRAQIHSVDIFLDEEAVLDKHGSVSSEALFSRYKDYCRKNGVTALGRNTFLDNVKNYSDVIEYGKVQSGLSRVNGFRGIRFSDFTDDVDNASESIQNGGNT